MKRFLPLLLGLALSAPAAATPPTGRVRSVRRDLVFVDLGRAHGVAPGDVLAMNGSGTKLEVVHLGEKQLAAKRVGPGEVRVGARVVAPRDPDVRARRPVVTLTPPSAERPPLPWSRDPLRRPVLIGSPALVEMPEETGGTRGETRISYVGLLDRSPLDLDLHRLEARSKVTVEVGDGFQYRHDLAGRLELGPDLDARHGAGSRPYYRIRQLELRWRSAGWSDAPEQREAGALEAAIGRIRLAQTPSGGLVDGARAELALGHGFSAGLHGGLAPALLDLAPSTDMAIVGGHASWVLAGDEWQARASLSTATSFWRGALNRLDVGASGALAKGRELDLYGDVVATMVDAGLETGTLGGSPTFSLSRAFAGARVRPLRWLTLDGSFSHDRFVADRETLAVLGIGRLDRLDRPAVGPRASAWLQVRIDATAGASLSLSGMYGFGSDSAELRGGAARLCLRDVFVPDLRVVLGYQLAASPATETHNPSVDLALALGRKLELGLGYGFTTFRSRLLNERQDEHRIDAGFDLLAAGPWRVHVRGTYAFGSEPSQVGLMGQLVWRFR